MDPIERLAVGEKVIGVEGMPTTVTDIPLRDISQYIALPLTMVAM
jgi:hypothetical protein